MSKRDSVLAVLGAADAQAYVPAAFFLHFDPACHFGHAAIDRHLEYFRATGMDFVKIQYERRFPPVPSIRRARDWRAMPVYGEEFFAPQLEVVEGIVKEVGREAVVVVTLYSPFMCAGHAVGEEIVLEHLRDDPEPVKAGMQAVAESLLTFVKACIRRGVDGFYHSTQGGESDRLADRTLFDEIVRPYDLALMNEADRSCSFNILHVCDYLGEYDDLTRFQEYPGHVVSCPLAVAGHPLPPADASRFFGRPVMGGLDRLGIITTGSEAEIRAATEAVLRQAPERFILGADCTVPADTPWRNLRVAIDTAHAWRRG
ncbi:MAG TPA: uroporphyrinogen decarboxylase family protein [Thermoanaerobaculaceae bacterium]|nr:uroporphyrinogen decarboxylase family protein [Thermoanaerobaculaceae bacterium]